MDNLDEGGCSFGPDRRLSAAYAASALIAVAAVVLTRDAPGRLLFAIAALILAAYAITDVLFWPRVRVGRAGLTVNTPALRASFGWDQVQDVRADSRQRLGLRLVTLEIDVADQLVVLSRRALGTDPERAAALIRFAAPW